MKGRTRATITGALIIAISSFVGGMMYSQWLMEVKPSPVPVMLPERPAPQPYVVPLAYADTLIYYCDASGVPVWLAARLFTWESGWNTNYVGRKNENGTRDFGIAALNSAYLDHFSIYNDGKPVNPLDAETAIRVGVRYLAQLYEDTGSWEGAAGAYNVGENAWKAGVRPVRHLNAVLGPSSK